MVSKNYYFVEIQFLNGDSQTFQLPKDLQGAMRAYRYANQQHWESLLTGALINYPSADYTRKNNYRPTIRLGKIIRVFAQKSQQKKRSRGQFLTSENWEQEGIAHFWRSVKFIQHDYSFWNKVILAIDYYRWKRWKER
ncbi:DUF7679 family protein [Streptococcus sp. S784/96/1]|uniref:DUF7679 family protein n=1 Tax=Streptococcus sp. S784/96/1 TaxID=2653499 RepID=UPI001386C631|nr:hypothetical protein [Streptococcus sp. S784/96/1]